MTTPTHRSGAAPGIDRDRTVTIGFDGEELSAHPGDTLASALLANGVRVAARGPYTGRPRGVWGIDTAEACAFVQVDSTGEPMVPATRVEVHDGLRAHSLAGRGELTTDPDITRYDKKWTHCDVLVVGGGPAGLAAARAAADTRARVLIVDEQPEPGGGLHNARRRIHGAPALDWVRRTVDDLADHSEVRILTRATVTGHHDHGEVVALQRRTDHMARPPAHLARHRLWHIRARHVVLATGAVERPIAFAGNDRPGVMLAGAAAGYAYRYGVPPGRRAVVFGAHDEALAAAVELHDAGVEIAAVADARPHAGPAVTAGLGERGIAILPEHGVVATTAAADGGLAAARVAPIDPAGRAREAGWSVECDLLAVSGGHDPALALLTQAGGTVGWSAEHAAFLPERVPQGVQCLGAAAGVRDTHAALVRGAQAGHIAASGMGRRAAPPGVPAPRDERTPGGAARTDAAPAALWIVTGPGADPAETFVDMQRDATVADIDAALAAGMLDIEHVKRHTTIGTGPDQGRTSGVLTAGILGQALGRSMDAVGGTTRRPPHVPIPLAAVAGRDRGDFLDPVRRSPMHQWHVEHGAVFEDVGQWKRPRYYPREDEHGRPEDMAAAVARECRAARSGVAVLDASTLGKILVEGSDAPEFLDRVYANMFSTLGVGRCRYGVMCKADGMVLDDGVSVRLAEDRYLMTTTSGNSDTVMAWLEEWLQTEWPHLCVHVTQVTDHWATVSVVGPRSRDVLRVLAPDLDVSAEGFGFMRAREAMVAGAPARVLRVSFTGELTYEINVPSWYGRAVWDEVLRAGEPYGITPYGTETMHVLRAEKGFIVVGHETDGSVTPVDAGLGWAVSTRKDFIGKRSLARPDAAREDRERLVGLLPEDPDTVIAEGAQLVAEPPGTPPVPMLGHVTSSYHSATLQRSFALALLRDGTRRHGERVYAVHLGEATPALVTDPVFYDREGARRDG